MADVIATVAFIQGEVIARAPDGTERVLSVGDEVREGDVIITSAGGQIELDFVDGPFYVMGENEQVTMTLDLTRDSAPASDEAATDDDVVDEVIALLEGDEDLLDGLEDPAAGPGGGDAGGGRSFVQLARISELTGDLAFNFPQNEAGSFATDESLFTEVAEGEATPVASEPPVETPAPGSIAVIFGVGFASGPMFDAFAVEGVEREVDGGVRLAPRHPESTGLEGSISGTTENVPAGNAVTIVITDSDGNTLEVDGPVTVQDDGSYSIDGIDLSGLVNGELTVDVSVADQNGDTQTSSTAGEIFDAPVADVTFNVSATGFVDGEGSPNAVLNGNIGTESTLPQTITVVVSGPEAFEELFEVEADANGFWEVSQEDLNDLGLEDGVEYTASVTFDDGRGTATADADSGFTLPTVEIDAFDVVASGIADGDNGQTNLTASGTTSNATGVTVNVMAGGEPVLEDITVDFDADTGDWSVDLDGTDPRLDADTEYTLDVVASDDSGNTASADAPATFALPSLEVDYGEGAESLLVDERFLESGSAAGEGEARDSGSILVNANGGFDSVQIAGTSITFAQLGGDLSDIPVIKTDKGEITLTGFEDLGDGSYALNFDYLLVQNSLGHSSDELRDEIDKDPVGVSVTAGGNVANAELNVSIVDDIPAMEPENPQADAILTLTNLPADAGFDNSFGFYIRDSDGNPSEGTLLFANVKDDVGGTATLDFGDLEGISPADIGFFILPDGAGLNGGLANGDSLTFEADGDGWVALKDGVRLEIADDGLVHFDDPSFNRDGIDYVQNNENDGQLNWEDRTDMSFDDVNVGLDWSFVTDQEPASDALVVDERQIGANGGSAVASANFSDNFNVNYGADGKGSNAFAFVIDAENGDSGLIDSGTGESVLLVLSDDGKTINGQIGGGDDPTSVFQLTVDDAGEVTFELFRGVEHPIPDAVGKQDAIEMGSGVISLEKTAIDGDGDAVTGKIDIGGVIFFLDDGPRSGEPIKATLDLQVNEQDGQIVEDSAGIAFSGDFTVDWGADGPAAENAIQFQSNGGELAGFAEGQTDLAIEASFGTLFVTKQENGKFSYTYTLNADAGEDLLDADNPKDTFTYVLTDADGDTASAELNFDISVTAIGDDDAVEIAHDISHVGFLMEDQDENREVFKVDEYLGGIKDPTHPETLFENLNQWAEENGFNGYEATGEYVIKAGPNFYSSDGSQLFVNGGDGQQLPDWILEADVLVGNDGAIGGPNVAEVDYLDLLGIGLGPVEIGDIDSSGALLIFSDPYGEASQLSLTDFQDKEQSDLAQFLVFDKGEDTITVKDGGGFREGEFDGYQLAVEEGLPNGSASDIIEELLSNTSNNDGTA